MAFRPSATRLSTSSLTAMPFFRTSKKAWFAIKLFEISVRNPSPRALSWSKSESDMRSLSRRRGRPSPPARVPDYEAISREGGVPKGLRPPLSGPRFRPRDRPEARGGEDPAALCLLRRRPRSERDPWRPKDREKRPASRVGLGRREAHVGARRQHDDDLGRRESVFSGQGEHSARDRAQDHRRRDGRSRQGARHPSDRRALPPEMGGDPEGGRSHAPSRVGFVRVSSTPLLESLFSRRLLVVSGKGGVGKTTVAATLAKLAADTGRTVLLVSTDGRGDAAILFEKRNTGYREVELA